QELGLVIVRQPSPIKAIEDLKTTQLIVSSTSHTAPTSVYPRVLNNLFGTKFKVVEGYKSSREALIAVERGEAEGHVSGASSGVLRAQISPWIQDGKVSVIAQVGLTKDPAYPAAALVTEFATTSEQREMLALMLAQQFMAYPLVLPPEVPAERVAALRSAFDATMQDAGFLNDTAHQGLQVKPARGADIEAMLVKLYDTPPAVLERFATLAGDQ